MSVGKKLCDKPFELKGGHGFRMDRAPVTNRQFRAFVAETSYVTLAERPPRAEDYPGALPHMLRAGSLAFTPPDYSISLSDWSR